MTQRSEKVSNPQALSAAALCLSACTFLSARSQESELGLKREPPSATSRPDPGIDLNIAHSALNSAPWEAQLPAFPKNVTEDPGTNLSVPTLTETSGQTPQRSNLLNTILNTSAVLISSLGYFFYAVRSTPIEKRSQHLVTRLATPFDQNESFYPGNTTSLRIWTTNNAALALSALAIAITNNQGFGSVIVPTVMCLGSAMVLPLALKYGAKGPSNTFMKSCEVLSYASIGLFVASQFESVSSAITATGFNSAIVGAVLGLGARTLSMIPFISDFIHEARHPNPEKGFPQLKNICLWTTGVMLGAATVEFPLSTAAIVPLGYMAQNLFFTAVAFGSYFVWRRNRAAVQETEKKIPQG